MPRNMSFTLTKEQFKNQTKTVTRRLGWDFLKVGDIVTGCEQCQGLKKGEKIKRMGLIRILKIDKEPLSSITKDDCIKEGFPEMDPSDFVKFFCDSNGVTRQTLVNRIKFEYLEAA